VLLLLLLLLLLDLGVVLTQGVRRRVSVRVF
jgi:hypothetical protein